MFNELDCIDNQAGMRQKREKATYNHRQRENHNFY